MPNLKPDRAQIEAQLHANFDDVPTEFEDGLVEIAYGVADVAQAHLFEFGELGEAARFAHDTALKGNNVYCGVALRKPDTARDKRTTDDDAYAAGRLWFDVDAKLPGVKARLGELDIGVACAVRTGTTPEMRAQGQIKLDAWTDDLEEIATANELLARAIGADPAVANIGRVMRLGGTVNFPKAVKRKRGYIAEQTQFKPMTDPKTHDLNGLITKLREATANGEDKMGDAMGSSERVDLEAEIAICKANEGGWHQAMKRIFGHLFAKGWKAGRVTEFLTKAGAIPDGLDADYAELLAWYVAKQPDIADRAPEFEPIETPDPHPEEAWSPTLPPGLVGDLAQYGADIGYVEAPVAALAGALIAASTLCGNQAVVAMPRGPVALNLYALVLAPSGKGKDTVRRVIAHALDAADIADTSARPASNAAFHKHLNDADGTAYLFMDEFGHMLKFAASTAGGHQQGVLTFATELFGMALGVLARRAYSSQKPMEKVEKPYVTVAALSVAQPVVDALSSKHVIDGTLNRYLTFIEAGGRNIDEAAKPMSGDLQKKCASLARASWAKAKLTHKGGKAVTINEGTRTFWAIVPTEGAKDRLLAFRSACEAHQKSAGDLEGLWVRSYELAVRVAGVVAMGCYDGKSLNPEMTADHAEWATDLVERLTRQTCALVADELADSETERDAKKMLKFIRDVISKPRKGKWHDQNKQGVAPHSQLVKHFARIEKWRRDQIIESLIESDDITRGKFYTDAEISKASVSYRPK